MKTQAVNYASVLSELMAQLLKPGLLLVVRDSVRPANAMTIGWAQFGRVWSQPMCTVLVRPSRYTFDLINRAGAFTVNAMPSGHDEAITRCGTVSGRDVDKISEQGWTVCTGETIDAPYIAQAALHLECRTVFTSPVTEALDAKLLGNCYPRGDLHMMYFGLVTGVFQHEV